MDFPDDCDWGTVRTRLDDADDGTLSVSYDQDFAVRNLTLSLTRDGQLAVELLSEFTNGRTPTTANATFARSDATEAATTFTGRWVTTNPDGGIPYFEITEDGANYVIEMWGQCSPNPCEWGTTTTSIDDASDNRLELMWDQGFVVRTQVMTLRDSGEIILTTLSEYTNGRTAQRTSNTYTKASP